VGGGTRTKIQSVSFAVNIAVTGQNLYWLAAGGGAYVYEGTVGVPNSGSSSIYYAGVNFTDIAVAPNGAHFYFVRYSPSTAASDLMSCDTSSVTCTSLVSYTAGYGDEGPGVVTDGTYIFWQSISSKTIERYTLSTATNDHYATNQFQPYGLAINGPNVYWGIGSGGIEWAPETTPAPASPHFVTGTVPNYVDALVSDGRYFYWLSQNASTVSWVPIGGGTAVTLGIANQPAKLCRDNTAIYWTNSGDGTVRRMALPL
jgi:hypothetical protein